jgi:glutathione S-transferase
LRTGLPINVDCARRLHGHGIGRHARSDIAEFAIRDVEALATILGGKPFLMGEKPCAADAFVFGIVTSILTPPLHSPIRGAMQRHANLVAYCDRITNQYFSGSPSAKAAGANDTGSHPIAVADRPHRSQQAKRAHPS